MTPVANVFSYLEKSSVVFGIQHSSIDFVSAFFSIATN